MEHIRKHFKKNDPVLFGAIKGDTWHMLGRTTDHFTGLCRIVIGQQVSVKAAASIFAKFTTLFPKKKPTTKRVLALTDAELRSAGLSRSKVAAIRDIATRIENRSIQLKNIDERSDEEITNMLVQARGIGPWSAEMFLMFHLGREDIFSAGDLGLRIAIKNLYKMKALPTPEASIKRSKLWAPYRSYACLILWETIDNKPGK